MMEVNKMVRADEFDSIFSLFFHKILGTIVDLLTWGNKLWHFH